MHSSDHPTPRRDFMTRAAGAAAALAAAGTIPGRLFAETGASAPPAPSGEWDLSWVDRLKAPHRQVFDSPDIAEGTALHQAYIWMKGYAQVYHAADQDLNPVLVFRHKGVPVVVGDSIWDRYQLGKRYKLKDPTTGKDARRNPFMQLKADDKYVMVWPDGGLDTLIGRGAVVLACDLALHAMAGQLAEKSGGDASAVKQELLAALVPGVTVMPSGVFAVARAEEAGCRYIASA